MSIAPEAPTILLRRSEERNSTRAVPFKVHSAPPNGVEDWLGCPSYKHVAPTG